MSKKVAELSSNLVAVKGNAVPAPDMKGRGEVSATVPSAARETLSPLNFSVPASFRREFKTYAATHDLKLNELLRLSFDAYRKMQGD